MWGTHKSKRAGPAHTRSENEMITFSTETSAHGTFQEVSGAFQLQLGTKVDFIHSSITQETYLCGSLWELILTHTYNLYEA